MRYSVLTLALATACVAPPAPVSIHAPRTLQHALLDRGVSELGARAQLVPLDGAPLDAVDLQRAADGVSFTGFIPAQPGDYTLEVTFTGQVPGLDARAFLGRWSSDSFTVSQGQTTEPVFSRPLDPFGRPEDGADPDGDGLSILDEVLWETDPDVADSDGDGLNDGADCDPTDPGSTFVIAEGGSHEDCDADGVRREGLDWAPDGADCNDKDPSVKPGADDPCGDGVDQDCSDATCPNEVSDATLPTISQVSPAADAEVGCHTVVSAVITDNGAVNTARLVFPDCPTPYGERELTMLPVTGAPNLYASQPINTAALNQGFGAACQTFEIQATDTAGNTATFRRAVRFAFEVPTVTRMSPDSLAGVTGAFTLEIDASAGAGVTALELWAAPKASDLFDLAQATQLAAVTSGTLSVSIDPAALSDGQHLLYPVVRDAVGNVLQPYGGAGVFFSQGEVSADYACLDGGLTGFSLPARVLVAGSTPYLAARMRDHLDEAIAAAAGVDAAAQMVSAKAFGLAADGSVDLTDATSYMKRWEYGFYNDVSRTWITVSWYTPAFISENPVIDADAGNVVEIDPIPDPSQLVDSDAAAAAFAASPGCGALVGADDDFIIYDVVGGQTAVTIGTYDSTWRATATEPITDIISCQ